MENEVKKEHKYLPVLITILAMLIVVAGVGVGVWYYMDQQAQEAAQDNAKQTAALQKQIDDLKNEDEDGSSQENDCKEYINKTLKFSLCYPQGYTVYDGGEKWTVDNLIGQSVAINAIDGSIETLLIIINNPGSGIGFDEESVTRYEAAIKGNKLILNNLGTKSQSEMNNDTASIIAEFEKGGNNYFLLSRFPLNSTKIQATEDAFERTFGTITFF